MLYYRYKLLGTFYEDDQLVNKIAIIPKRKGDPVFSGFIYITESTWRIHSTDLRLQKDAQIDFIDSMQITQSYAKVNETTYMPYSQNLNVSLNAFGFRMQAKFAGIYTNYEIDPDLPDRFFDAEVWKINSDANEKDSLYWQQHRKVPLTSEEKADYREKDSLEILQRSKPYLDSVDRAGNRMAFADLVFGYRNYQRYHQMSYHVTGILNFINYNTVEGFAPSISFTAEKRWDDNRRLRTGLTLRYGFANNEPSAKIRVAYLFDPVKTALWSVEGGRFVEQFNNYNPISPLVNTVYTLFAGENYMKLFMNGYVKGAIGKEVVNGVGLLATTSYNHRSVLENSTSKSFASESNLHFTSNDPQFAMCDSSVCFSDYNAWLFQLTATIKFGQKYISRPDEKIVIGSKYPALSIAWLRGLPWLNSAVDFDKLELSVKDHYKVGTFGEGDYRLTGGAFLNRHYVGAVELKHFNGNQTILASADHLEVYQLLPYYTYSTDQWYLQGHGEHHFQGLLFNHIPLVRKLQLREVVGVHYLQTTSLQYAELSVGIEHILKVIRIDYAFAFSNTGHFRSAILIGVNFNGNGITISNDD